jgi:hypothetical protein
MCVVTATAVATVIGAGAVAGTSIYAAHEQSGAARDAAASETSAANHAADLQSQSAADALAFTKEQAAQARIDADTTQHNNYDQWRAAQVYQNDTTAARTRSINDLGSRYGVAARDIPEMQIPDYRSTIGGAAGVPSAAGASSATTPGASSAGASAAAVPVANGDYQAWFNSLTGGRPLDQAGLLSLEPQLRAAGITITNPNTSGDQSKIILPTGQAVRVLDGDPRVASPTVWIPQPGTGAGASSASASSTTPGTVGGAAGYQPTAALAATTPITPPVTPALTVDPYQRRTVADYFAA